MCGKTFLSVWKLRQEVNSHKSLRIESWEEHNSVYISDFRDQDVVAKSADGKMMWSMSS